MHISLCCLTPYRSVTASSPHAHLLPLNLQTTMGILASNIFSVNSFVLKKTLNHNNNLRCNEEMREVHKHFSCYSLFKSLVKKNTRSVREPLGGL